MKEQQTIITILNRKTGGIHYETFPASEADNPNLPDHIAKQEGAPVSINYYGKPSELGCDRILKIEQWTYPAKLKGKPDIINRYTMINPPDKIIWRGLEKKDDDIESKLGAVIPNTHYKTTIFCRDKKGDLQVEKW